jgi:hypothetical protein
MSVGPSSLFKVLFHFMAFLFPTHFDEQKPISVSPHAYFVNKYVNLYGKAVLLPTLAFSLICLLDFINAWAK